MANSLGAGSYDYPHPQKNPSITYDPNVLMGTIPVAGSVSSIFDLSGWSEFALAILPGSGTILGGTVLNVLGGQSLQDTFMKVYGTTGAVQSSIQMGSTGNQIITKIDVLKPLRFAQFVAGGTQSVALQLNLIVK